MDKLDPCLWKFRPVDILTLKTITNKKLWFSHPRLFNDPFDNNFDPASSFRKLLDDLSSEQDKMLVFEQFEKLEAAIPNNKSAYLSLSSNCKHNLMWSHYADSHKGIAFGFNFDGTALGKLNHLKVLYSQDSLNYAFKNHLQAKKAYLANPTARPGSMHEETYELFTNFLESGLKIFQTYQSMKAECWKYEEEVRLEIELGSVDENGKLISFDAECLKFVVFGLSTTFEDVQLITNLMSGQEWSHVKFLYAEKISTDLSIGLSDFRVY